MRGATTGRRCARAVAAPWLPVTALLLGACGDGLFHDPAPALSPALSLSLSATGGPDDAFGKADRVRVVLSRSGAAVLDTTVTVSPGGGEVRLRLPVDLEESDATLEIDVEVLRGSDLLFRGEASARLERGLTSELEVDLVAVAAGLVGSPPSLILTALGEAAELEALALFATGDTVGPVAATWSGNDPGVVELSPDGAVVAVGEGSTRAEGRAEGFSATVPVTVAATVTAVDVEPLEGVVAVGDTLRLSATAQDRNGNALERTIGWSSDRPDVALVDDQGAVLGVRVGTAVITATADEASGSAAVEVVQPAPEATTLSPSEVFFDGAIVRGMVNPRGSPTTAWFELDVDPQLSDPSTTSPQGVGAGTVDVDVHELVEGLAPLTTYYVRVAASNDGGTTRGEVISFTTPAAPPEAPADLRAVYDPDFFRVELTWIDTSDVEETFQIERRGPGENVFSPLATVGADTEAYTDGSVGSGPYEYRVRACNGSGCSAFSNVASVFVSG